MIMNKNNILVTAGSLVGAALLLSSASLAFAESGDASVGVSVGAQVGVGGGSGPGEGGQAPWRPGPTPGNGGQTPWHPGPGANAGARGDVEANGHMGGGMMGSSTASTTHVLGPNGGRGPSPMGLLHRSDIANVVAHLRLLAEQNGTHGIGQDLRLVAEAQASTSASTTEAMEHLNSEGFLKKLFFGPDYRNLGALRSTIVTTENNIDRLERALSSTTDATVKADLQLQIDALKAVAASTTVFVQAHANTFSLFGWFTHIFNK